MRMIDLSTTIAVLEEAAERPIGARRRVAEHLGLQASVVTDRVHRVEKEIKAELMAPDGCPTEAGTRVLYHGHRILAEYAEMTRTAQ